MSNLLQLATRITRRLPLSSDPASVIGNDEPQIQQLLELMQEEGDDLVSRHAWSVLTATWTIDVGSTSPHSESYPTGFSRFRTDADVWRSGSNVTPLIGPVPSNKWQVLTSSPGTYPGYWRPYGSGIQILGVSSTETVTVEYVSKNWILDDDGSTGKSVWASDTDTLRLPELLYVQGVRWRWKQSKGLDYAEDMAGYERELERSIAADRLARPISTTRLVREDPTRLTWPGQVTT